MKTVNVARPRKTSAPLKAAYLSWARGAERVPGIPGRSRQSRAGVKPHWCVVLIATKGPGKDNNLWLFLSAWLPTLAKAPDTNRYSCDSYEKQWPTASAESFPARPNAASVSSTACRADETFGEPKHGRVIALSRLKWREAILFYCAASTGYDLAPGTRFSWDKLLGYNYPEQCFCNYSVGHCVCNSSLNRRWLKATGKTDPRLRLYANRSGCPIRILNRSFHWSWPIGGVWFLNVYLLFYLCLYRKRVSPLQNSVTAVFSFKIAKNK